MNDLALYDSVPTDQLRDRVMDDLVKHYSLERIDLSEFERRTDLVSKAATRGEMLAQLADLPALSEEAGRERSPSSPSARIDRGTWSVAAGNVRASDATVAIFGGSDLRGNWRAPRRLTALCLFGGTNIDLRKAIVPAEGLTISCACAFGGADIIVPPGMRVMTRGMGIFGGFDRADHEPNDPEAPTIVVEGIAVFGGVSVKVKA